MSEFKELIDINKEHVSESFCVLPWMHLNVQPNGEVFQCCMAPHDRPVGDVTKNTLPEIWNNHSMKDIRNKCIVHDHKVGFYLKMEYEKYKHFTNINVLKNKLLINKNKINNKINLVC